MSGQLHTKQVAKTQSHSYREVHSFSESTVQAAASSVLLPSYIQENIPVHTNSETLSTSAIAPVTLHPPSDDTEYPHVDFSSCQRLDWTDNTKDWQKYVNIKELKTDDIAMSCPMWEPTKPMKITPDEASILYLFQSEKNMKEALSTVATKDSGSAVVSRTWRCHIADANVTEDLPPGHICDILTVTDKGRLAFWVVVDSCNDDKFHCQMDYLMATGRMLKYQIVQKGEGDDMSNVWIQCRLLPLIVSDVTERALNRRLSETQEIQAHLCDLYQDGVNFKVLQRALTMIIISKESPLKRCIGEDTSINLSEQQAEVLMHKAKVSYIAGPAGSGKSYTGASLYKMYGKERSVYICTTKEFLQYLKFNGCTGTLVLCDQDLDREIRSGTFENKICIVIDDCHKFTCTRKSMKKLFEVLKKDKHLSLFVFADNDYQSFDRHRQQAMYECILDLTRTMLNDVPLNWRLTKIYRNTRKVVSFVQAAIQDVHDGHQEIESVNIENGEGVECISMPNLWENNPDNAPVVYLRDLLLLERYTQSEVAILLESEYTTHDIQQCKQIITEHVPNVTVQSADVFPRAGVIVDFVGSFLGLDASVCVFILSNTQKMSDIPRRNIFPIRKPHCQMKMYNPRYEVFLASRATHKAVFVVPKLHDDLIKQMKFDHFKVCLCVSD